MQTDRLAGSSVSLRLALLLALLLVLARALATDISSSVSTFVRTSLFSVGRVLFFPFCVPQFLGCFHLNRTISFPDTRDQLHLVKHDVVSDPCEARRVLGAKCEEHGAFRPTWNFGRSGCLPPLEPCGAARGSWEPGDLECAGRL